MRSKRRNINSNFVFLIASLLLFAGFAYSEAFITMGAVLVFLQPVFYRNKNEFKQRLRSTTLLWLLVAMFLVYCIGAVFTKDTHLALYELNRNLFWILLPIGVGLTQKIQAKKFWNFLLFFAAIITLGSLITSINFFFYNDTEILDFRTASTIRHSSLSIYVVFSIFILITGKQNQTGVFQKIKSTYLIVWILWLLFFLTVQKSLLGMVALFAASFVFLAQLIFRQKTKQLKYIFTVLLIALIAAPLGYVGHIYKQFYAIKEHEPDKTLVTKLGNQYTFRNNKMKENGRYVLWYISEKEMATTWNEKFGSDIYSIDKNGYRVYDTAIRYLTSKGLRKDAEGVLALTQADYENIINGIPNHIYISKKYSLYPRIYQSIWELDVYRNSNNPNNKSFAQRIEFTKTAIYIISNNPWGVGVGNWKIAYTNAYNEMNSNLSEDYRIQVHNQYLSYMIKFGILGFLLILVLVLLPAYTHRKSNTPLLYIFLAMVAVVCLGDNLLELHTGLPFFTYFYSLFLFHSPKT